MLKVYILLKKAFLSFKGDILYQGFSFFFAISFYVSDFMYLLRNQFIFHNFQW